MRGSNTLFADLFIPEKPGLKQVKGRSADLNQKRNECLVNRYFFHAQKQLRYDVVVSLVSDEFFLSTVTIINVIDENFSTLAQLKKAPPTKNELKRRWPHLEW